MNTSLPNKNPSRTFIIRGSIALGIVLLVVVTQSTWFKNIFKKKEPNLVATNTTIGDIVGKDSNGNGTPDWQEQLWGLDPTVLYTNGVSNKEIIEQKRRALGITSSVSDEPLSTTDKLARDLYTLAIALGQNDQIDKATLQSVASSMGNAVEIKTLANKYTASDITTTKTTHTSLVAYKNALQKTITAIDTNSPGIEIALNAIESGDYSTLDTLAPSITVYAEAAQSLKKVVVPVGLAQYHIDLINGIAGMAEGFVYLQYLDTDTPRALSGIAISRNHMVMFTTAVDGITQYLTRYGIL